MPARQLVAALHGACVEAADVNLARGALDVCFELGYAPDPAALVATLRLLDDADAALGTLAAALEVGKAAKGSKAGGRLLLGSAVLEHAVLAATRRPSVLRSPVAMQHAAADAVAAAAPSQRPGLAFFEALILGCADLDLPPPEPAHRGGVGVEPGGQLEGGLEAGGAGPGQRMLTLEEVESGLAAPKPKPKPKPKPPRPSLRRRNELAHHRNAQLPHPGLRWLRLRAETLRARGLPMLGADDGAVVAYCRAFGCAAAVALQLVANDGPRRGPPVPAERRAGPWQEESRAGDGTRNTSKGAGGGGGGGKGGGKGGRKGGGKGGKKRAPRRPNARPRKSQGIRPGRAESH